MNEKVIIHSKKAPQAIGPYSMAVKVNNFVYSAGQLGIDPKSNEITPGGIEAETIQSLSNIKNILEAAGTSMKKVVKTTVFLRDMEDFSLMNNVYAQFFTENFPARTTVQVAALPKNAAVEIEAIAVI